MGCGSVLITVERNATLELQYNYFCKKFGTLYSAFGTTCDLSLIFKPAANDSNIYNKLRGAGTDHHALGDGDTWNFVGMELIVSRMYCCSPSSNSSRCVCVPYCVIHN